MAEFLYKPKSLPQETIEANLERLKEFQEYSTWRKNYIKQIEVARLNFELQSGINRQEFTHFITKPFYAPPSLDLFRKLYPKK